MLVIKYAEKSTLMHYIIKSDTDLISFLLMTFSPIPFFILSALYGLSLLLYFVIFLSIKQNICPDFICNLLYTMNLKEWLLSLKK